MNSPALIEDDPLRDPATYRARRAAAGAAWRQLAAAEQSDPAGLLGLLEEVARLDAAEVALPWDRPAGSLPADVRDLLLADVDGDGHFEAVLVTGSGAAHVFRPEDAWEAMGAAVLPADAPPVRGLESPPALYGGADIVRVVTGAGQAPDQLYELYFLPPGKLVVQELVHGPGEPARRRLALARSSEPAAADGLHRVLTLADDGDFLSITPLLAPAIQEPLSAGPTALVYATHSIFLADTRERIRRWEWREGTLAPVAGWEVAVDGQVTALALIPTETTPLLLVATDERRLLAVEDGGDVVAQYATDTIWRTMAPQMARGELLVVADEGDVRRYPLPPLGEPLPRGVAPLPSLTEVAARLPADEVRALMERWLNGDDPVRTRAAVKLFLAGSASGVTASPAEIVAAVDRRQATARRFLETAEPLLLKIRRADDPRLEAVMNWAIRRAGEHHPSLQHRINRLTARLAARFPDQMGERPAWQKLDEIRRRDDRLRARELATGRDEAELRAGLNTYAKILLGRREERWIFATTGAVRAILPLPAPGQVLVAARDSKLYHLDLARSQVLAMAPLANGAIPRALTGGVLASGDPAAIMVTDRGELFRIAADGPAAPQPLPDIDVSPADPRALALMPATAARPAHFFAGGRDGQILSYRRDPAGSWIPATPILLPDDIVHTLSLISGDDGHPPLLLAGCGQAGRGTLHQLTPDGSAHRPPLTFTAPVLDARALVPHDSDRYRLIVLTANGYLHAATPDGARRWQYRVGRAARNLAVHDINGDGQPEIIVGGRHRTVTILDAGGNVLWSIPARAPVTYVASLPDAQGRPLLLISDLDRGLHVIGINPPGSRRERALKAEAEEALQHLADVEGSTTVDLIARWVLEAPTPLLRGYAFRVYGERFHLRQAELRRHLLAAVVDDDTPLVQRAYARALVDALLAVPPEEAGPEEGMERLLELIRRDTVGLAILQALLHAENVSPALFPRWSPLLKAAAAVPDADVQRAVLFVLRRLRPWQEERMDLDPAAWEILRTLLRSRSDADAWIARDAAALLRDLTGDDGALWTLAHRLPARLPESDLLARLGQSNPRLVDSFPLANALGALEQLRHAGTVEAAATIQNQISDSVARRFPTAAGAVAAGGPPPDGAPLVLFYGALAEAVRCRDEGEWRRFVNRRRQPEGLAYLLEAGSRAVAVVEPAGGALLSYLTRLKEAVDDFMDAESPSPEQLRRLIGRLRQEAELLVTIPGTSDVDLILYRALAGMVGAWVRSSGVLTRWFEEATRPATPRLTVHRSRLLPDRIELTARLFNPSHTEPIEELTIFVARAAVRVADLHLDCRVEPRQSTDGVSLPPRGELQLRLQVPLSPAQWESVGQQPQIAAHLDLPLHYFQPPRSWPTPTITVPMSIRGTTAIHVDWMHDLPVAWQALSGAIEQARALDRAQDRVTPLLITCAPFARQGLVDYLRQLNPHSAPVIDLRQMVPHLRKARREEQDGGVAVWLAWLARHIWPQADPDSVARIEREGAPHHFFRTMAVDAANVAPAVIVLDNLEGVLFGLAPLPAELGVAVEEALRFLDAWAREGKVQLVLLSTLLGEQMLRTEWPALYERMTVVASDRPVKANDALQAERVRMVERVLDIHQLRPVLRRFEPPLDGAGIVELAGSYLHVLDLLIFPALHHLLENPELEPGAARDYFLERAAEHNFFNALWTWQNFYERLALVILAYGEIPLEDRGMAEPGMVLSRDYFERSNGNRLAGEPTLPAGRVLTQRDVVTIRANRAYRPGDVHIRGMSPRQPAVTAWGAAGELLLDLLLRAGDGERLLARMEKEGALRRRQNRALGEYYELGLPLYEAWLHQNGVLKHILAAANGEAAAWYPPALAHDQRPGWDRLLFPRRPPGPARVDLPLEVLPEIQAVLNSRTQPLFLNLYGLRAGNGSAAARWQQLVETGRALRSWAEAGDASEECAGDLLRQLGELLGFTAESAPVVEPAPGEKGKKGRHVAAVRVRLEGETGRLTKPALLLAIDDGAAVTAHQDWLRAWIQERLIGPVTGGEPRRSDNRAGPRLLNRDLVLVLARRGGRAVRRRLAENGGDATIVVVCPEEIARLAAALDPPAELRALLRREAGRLPFSPYQTAGSLRSAALFVGHDRLLNGILSRLPQENQLILGSRGSGKSSLLNEVARQAPNAFGSQEILRLMIRLENEKTVDAFYAQIRWQLEAHGHEAAARALGAFPDEDYADLLEVMSGLAETYGQPVLILADDVDALFRHDRDENGGRFLTFLSDRLSGAPGRPCAVVATARPDLPLDGAASAAALEALGPRHRIWAVDRPAIGALVEQLREVNVDLAEPDKVVAQVAQATGGVPRYVQTLCHGLLIQLDRAGKNGVGPAEVEAARQRALDPLLRRELWEDLAVVAPADRERCRLIIAAAVADQYGNRLNAGAGPDAAALPDAERHFDAGAVMGFLQRHASRAVPETWTPTPGEISRLLRLLTAGGAVAPAPEAASAFHFPGDLLPDLLIRLHRRPDSGFDLYATIDALAAKVGSV